jgi:hypothetical protein
MGVGRPANAARDREHRPMNSFQSTVSALSYSILRERCPSPGFAEEHLHNRVVAFVLDQHGRMAAYLRWPMVALTLGFDAWGVFRAGRPFHRQEHASRQAQIEAWRSSRIGPFRDLVRFYETLVIFGGYSMHRADAGASRPSVRSGASGAVGIE